MFKYQLKLNDKTDEMTIMKFHFVQENEVFKNIGKYFGNELGRKKKTIS